MHQLDPVGARQHHVEQNQVWPLLLHKRERLLRVGGHYRLEAGIGERFPHVTEGLGIVVHHEDGLPRRRFPSRVWGVLEGLGCGPFDRRDGEGEPRAQSRSLALGPDASPVGLDDALADR